MKINIDVIIVSYKRSLELCQSIKALIEASSREEIHLNFFILINGPDVTTENTLIQNFSPIKDRLHLYKSSHQLKPGQARNFLISKTSQDWVYFIDDDANADLEVFTHFKKVILSQPDVLILGGPNVTPPSSSFFEKANGAVLESRWGTLFTKPRYSSTGELRLGKEAELSSCNLFVHRSALSKHIYPEHYQTAEETHLLLSLTKSFPVQCFYDPHLVVFHKRRDTYALFVKQIFRYAQGRAHLISEGRSFSLIYFLPTATLFLLVYLLLEKQFLAVGLFVSIYFLMTLVFSMEKVVKLKTVKAIITLPLYTTIHLSYACGLYYGLLQKLMDRLFKREKNSPAKHLQSVNFS